MSIFMSIDFFACSQFVSEVQTCVHSKHCLYHLRRDNVCRRLPRWLLGHAWESCSHDGDLLNRIDEANLLVHKLQALVDFDTHCRCGWKKCTQHNSGGTARVQTVGEADKLQTIICMLMTLLTAAKDGILVKLELTGTPAAWACLWHQLFISAMLRARWFQWHPKGVLILRESGFVSVKCHQSLKHLIFRQPQCDFGTWCVF